MDKYNIPIKLVPCCLFYDRPEVFRSKAYMEFEEPYEVPFELVEIYRRDKGEAVNLLLADIERVFED